MNPEMESKVHIILPPAWSVVYRNVARLLKYSFEDLNLRADIVEWGCHRSVGLNIVLGWNLLPTDTHITGQYILYQLEPLNQSFWEQKYCARQRLFDQALAIWDYSLMNVSLLGTIHKEVVHVPIGFHKKLTDVIADPYPDFDVLFTGTRTPRRWELLKELQQHCGVSTGQKWGRDLTEAISRSKLLINIHQTSTPTPLEQLRLSYAMNNHCLVISEESEDNSYPWLQTWKKDELIPIIIQLLHNPDSRDQLQKFQYHHFSQFPMKSILFSIIKKLNRQDNKILTEISPS